MKVAKAYYLQLFRGQGNVVQIGDGVDWDPNEDQTDGKLTEWVAEIIESNGSIGRKVKIIAEQLASKWLLITGPAGPGTFLQRIGRGALKWMSSYSVKGGKYYQHLQNQNGSIVAMLPSCSHDG